MTETEPMSVKTYDRNDGIPAGLDFGKTRRGQLSHIAIDGVSLCSATRLDVANHGTGAPSNVCWRCRGMWLAQTADEGGIK